MVSSYVGWVRVWVGFVIITSESTLVFDEKGRLMIDVEKFIIRSCRITSTVRWVKFLKLKIRARLSFEKFSMYPIFIIDGLIFCFMKQSSSVECKQLRINFAWIWETWRAAPSQICIIIFSKLWNLSICRAVQSKQNSDLKMMDEKKMWKNSREFKIQILFEKKVFQFSSSNYQACSKT